MKTASQTQILAHHVIAPKHVDEQFNFSHEEILALLETLIEAGGPKPTDYKILDTVLSNLYKKHLRGELPEQQLSQLKDLFNEEFKEHTIHGYGLRKPMGYAGDFKIIDMIYTEHITDKSLYKNWDHYFHYNSATKAVRNRKQFFKNMISEKLEHHASLRLLNIASGPARDLSEMYQLIEPARLATTCVELDARAIQHATKLCANYLEHISFIEKNIFQFKAIEKYNVIWSAGLFDYFDNRLFVSLLKRFLGWLEPKGEIILGNFSENNSSQGYMELLGEWFLQHRSEEELIMLAKEAGVKRSNISVEREPLGVNLFLRIRL